MKNLWMVAVAVLVVSGVVMAQDSIPAPAGYTGYYSITPTSMVNNGAFSIPLCDFDGDGSIDILVGGSRPISGSEQRDGCWGVYSYEKKMYLVVVSGFASIGSNNPIAAADFDGDKISEILWNNKIYKYGHLPPVLAKKN